MSVVRNELLSALDTPNIRAFLRVIRFGETDQTQDAYRMLVGGGYFQVPPWEHPKLLRAVKLRDGRILHSTAAGAYQFLFRTWDEMQKKYDLDDFSPLNQDIAAVGLIHRRGALGDVKGGYLHVAIRKCAQEWASLPGSPYKQPTKSLAKALEVFTEYGGRITET